MKMMDANGRVMEVSPEMLDAAESILHRVKHGVLTDQVEYLAVYLEKLANKRGRRIRRNEERRRARAIEAH
jgi:hypothetical protein